MVPHTCTEEAPIRGSAKSLHRWRRRLRMAGRAGLLAVLVLSVPAARAGERVLRFHHFLPEKSPQHQDIFLPWAHEITHASNGRLRIEITGDMQLGGRPAELISQVETGEVDIVWTAAGYTPGRFPRLEVFELPWIASSRASATSQALYEFYETQAREELSSVRLLAVWCHPSGVIMSRTQPILKPKDAAGTKLRVPSIVVGEALRAMGAQTRLSPAPKVLKQLQDGTADGALFPYEVIPALKLETQVHHITEFAGHRGLYTTVYLLAMGKKTYESLDTEDRKVIDAHSGAALSARLGQLWDDVEEAGREEFTAAGGEVSFIKNAEYDAWVHASEPAIQAWKERIGRRAGIDSEKLLAAARALVAKYTARGHDD